MFLAAMLYGVGYSAPVKIRNMSASGALAEGAAVPEVGVAIRLVRGSLSVPGIVRWANEGRCGIEFASLVCVRDWLAPPANSEQQRVDDVVRLVKGGAVALNPAPRSITGITSSRHCAVPAQLGDDLRRVCALIDKLGESLLCDEATVVRHGLELQNFDICRQTIAAVADVLGGDSNEAANRLENLRVGCEQALHAHLS